MTPSLPRAPQVAAKTLWAVNVHGPDDLVPVADYLTAVRVANAFNEWWLALKIAQPLHEYDPRMWAVPVEYDGDAGQHAEWVKSPSKDYLVFFEQAATLASSDPAPTERIETYYARQIAWSRETFGPGARTGGVLDHIRKELKEIEAEPTDLSEWIDVIILAMDGFWRHGGTPDDLMPRLLAKQQKNMARKWPDWRTMSEDSAIEHDRSNDPAPDTEAGGAEVDALKKEADRAYCRFLDKMSAKACLGEEAKMRDGKFGAAELNAHREARELLGYHRGIYRALSTLRQHKPQALPDGYGDYWHSIDTAPEDQHVILATSGDHVGEALMLIDEDTGQQKWTWAGGPVSKFHAPLGWRPMPSPIRAPVLSDNRPGGFDGPTGAE